MSRLKDRQHLDAEGRVTLLEEDMDSVEKRQERHAKDVRQIKVALWTFVFTFILAALLLAFDLANGSNLTIT